MQHQAATYAEIRYFCSGVCQTQYSWAENFDQGHLLHITAIDIISAHDHCLTGKGAAAAEQHLSWLKRNLIIMNAIFS